MSSILIHRISYLSLFKDLSLSLSSKKIGLVGRNGIGKSSLLKLITGELTPHEGSIERNISIGYLPQELISGLALSGGEKMQYFIKNIFFEDPDYLILDEPTNNLDVSARQWLYKIISRWRKGLLVVSHDRELLNQMDEIIELTTKGVKIYGGNYDFYSQQKAIFLNSHQKALDHAKKKLKQTTQSIQSGFEKHDQKKSRGRKQFLSGKIDKLQANSLKGKSERTQSRKLKQNTMLLDNANKLLDQAKENIEVLEKINIQLPKTYVPAGKIVLDIKNLYFVYPNANKAIFKNFNFSLIGPARVGLMGNNGIGKTTLIKLIMAKHENIYCGIERIAYLDQELNLLDKTKSIIDNFLQFNPEVSEREGRFSLASFLFRREAVLKKAGELSSGEKLRATLACILMSHTPPQLLILDEPTNHLDLESICQIESALKNYQGAMIIISHDKKFLENCEATIFNLLD